MKKNILFLLLIVSLSMQAQDFTFSNLNETYINLLGSTSINNSEIWDDPEYDLVLPFSFTINGNTNSNFKIYDSYIIQQTTAGTFQKLSPLENDLIDRGGSVSLSPISYLVEGNVGARIVKIEFQNCTSFSDDSNSMFVNFQIWLYEGSNIIEYRYGTSSINDENKFYSGDTGAIIGITGIDSNDNLFNINFLSGSASNPILLTSETDITGTPSANMVYRFTPSVLNISEFNKTSITLFPNPFKDYIYIDGLKSNFIYSIFNLNGTLINSKESIDSENKIDTKHLASGVYLLKIISENEIIFKKIIKM